MSPSPYHRAGWFILFLSLMALVAACTPTTPVPPSSEGDVLFSDDFAMTNSNWALFDTPAGTAQIQQGNLYLTDLGHEKSISTSLLNRQWDNVIIRTQLRQAAGTQNNWMGVTCRQADESNYYLFAIGADGYYLLLKMLADKATPLAGPETSPAIHPDRGINTLEVSCVANTLTLSINQQELASVTDESFVSGQISLFTDSLTNDETSVAFDNFVIIAP
ncbi:MAG: hypothetical protein U9Q70_01755 [Chloroflexota bacterium]|nr:hypothetical protein [Chloroflexota bacterium]